MPRESQIAIKGQKKVNPQETFDFTVPRREGAARTLNFMEEQAADPKSTSVLNFIDKMSGLVKDVTKFQEGENVKKRKAGAAAQGRGEDPEENAHWAFLEGYELMAGASDAYKYEKELAQLLNTDITSDVETFNGKKDQITHNYINGRSDAYVEGFVSRGRNVEANAEMKFQEAKHEQMQTDFLTKGIDLFKLDYNEHKSTGASMEENAEAGRELATSFQKEGSRYGLTKQQVSEALVKSIGSASAINGRPEDMMFMLYPDVKGGTAMIDNPELSKAINSYINTAISTRKSKAKEAIAEKVRIEKEFAVEAGKAIVKAIDENNPTLGGDILEETGQYMNLDDYSSLTKALRDMRSGSDAFFAVQSDQFLFDNLRIAAKKGILGLEELQEQTESLTRADYRRVFADIVTKWEEDVALSTQGGKKTKHQITMEKARKNGEGLVAQKGGKLNAILNPYGAARRLIFYTVHYDDVYAEKAALVGGVEKMTAEDMQYVIDKAAYDAFQYEKPSNVETMPPNPDEITKPKPVDKEIMSTDKLENAFNRLPS